MNVFLLTTFIDGRDAIEGFYEKSSLAIKVAEELADKHSNDARFLDNNDTMPDNTVFFAEFDNGDIIVVERYTLIFGDAPDCYRSPRNLRVLF